MLRVKILPRLISLSMGILVIKYLLVVDYLLSFSSYCEWSY
jgi:hypothetical protein